MTSTTRRLSVFAGALLTLLALPTLAQDAPEGEASSENRIWERVSQRFDIDGDGQITNEEFDSQNDRFTRMDRDQDGVLTAADFEGIEARGRTDRRRGPRGPAMHLMRQADINQDGELARDEWTGYLATLDSNTDGSIDRSELEAARPADAPEPPQDRPQREIEVSVERLSQTFDRLDANADGVITEDEQPRRRGRGARRGPRGLQGAGES
ncbi:MAG: hypothetical protein AAGE94_01385 [Acidobacteriota bacterium]